MRAKVTRRPVPQVGRADRLRSRRDAGEKVGIDTYFSRRALQFDRERLDPNAAVPRAQDVLAFTRGAIDFEGLSLSRLVPQVPGDVEPAEELGPHIFNTSMLSYQGAQQQIEKGASGDVMRFNDATVHKFHSYMRNGNFETILKEPNPVVRIEAFRNMVRAAELGASFTPEQVEKAFAFKWPVDDATARVLRRAAVAFNVDQTDVPYGGLTLARYVSAAAKEAHRQSGQADAALKARGFDIMGTLENYYPSLRLLRSLAGASELQPVLFERVLRMKLPNDLRDFAMRSLALDDPALGANLFEVPKRATHELPPPDDRRSWVRSDDELQTPIGPLSETAEPGKPYDRRQLTAHEFFVSAASDENVRSMEDQGVWDFESWLAHGPSGVHLVPIGDLARYAARRLELHPNKAEVLPEVQKSLLDKFQSRAKYTADDLTGLLRLARAAEVPFDRVLVRPPDRPMVTLSDAARELQLPRDESIDRSMNLAAAGQTLVGPSSSVETKLDVLTRLQDTRDEAPNASEVAAFAREVVGSGAYHPVTESALSLAQREAWASALVADQHLGTAAMLGGLLGGGDWARVAEKLEAQGFEASEVADWVAAGKKLEALDASAKHFITEEMDAPDADFSLMRLRLELAGQKTWSVDDLLALEQRWGHGRRDLVVKTIVEWGHLRDAEATTRAFIERGLKEDRLRLADVIAQPGADEKAHTLETLMARFLEAPNDENAQALAHQLKLSRSLEQRSRTVDEVLAELHGHDLQDVAPLDEADVQLGGVAGKRWQTAFSPEERLGHPGPQAVADARKRHRGAAYALDMLKTRVLFDASRAFVAGLPVDVRWAMADVEQLMAQHVGAADKPAATLLISDFGHWLDQTRDDFVQ